MLAFVSTAPRRSDLLKSAPSSNAREKSTPTRLRSLRSAPIRSGIVSDSFLQVFHSSTPSASLSTFSGLAINLLKADRAQKHRPARLTLLQEMSPREGFRTGQRNGYLCSSRKLT